MANSDIIGKELGSNTVVLERGPVSNFAKAVKDENPVYLRPDAAQEAGFDNIPAPPTYAFAMNHFGQFPELQPEGKGGNPMFEVIGTLMKSGGMVLHGEQEFVYHRPMVVGDVLTSEGKVTDMYEKEGSGGKKMTFVTAETLWRDASGEPVVTSIMTLLHRA
jgi:acyl dehydratase